MRVNKLTLKSQKVYFLFHVQLWSVDCSPTHSVLEIQADTSSNILCLHQLEYVGNQFTLAQKRYMSLLFIISWP